MHRHVLYLHPEEKAVLEAVVKEAAEAARADFMSRPSWGVKDILEDKWLALASIANRLTGLEATFVA